MKELKKFQICIITEHFEEGRGGYIFKKNLISVLSYLSHERSNSKINIIAPHIKIYSSFFLFRIIRVIIIELITCYLIFKLGKKNYFIFFTMGPAHFLPIFISKILGHKVIYVISGLAGKDENFKIMKIIYRNTCFSLGKVIIPLLISNFEELNYKLSDVLVVESPNLSRQLNIKSSCDLIIFNGALHVDIKKFFPEIQFSKRGNIIGYFGAFTEFKGINNLIEAIPKIFIHNPSIQFLFCGDGPEIQKIEDCMKHYNLDNDIRIFLVKKLSHEKIHEFLNKVKLIVLPSYGEGLPNIVLESMSCATPVLATPVGGIPDIIIDSETGYIMDNNTPECIVKNICRSLNDPNLETISKNARTYIENGYSIEKSIERYRKIIEHISLYED